MRKYIILISTMFISTCVFSQGNNDDNKNIPTIIPPSPTVNSLMKFEEVPVSNYTGIADISIPIANLPTGLNNIPINLSLKYHVNNAKSASKASEVGLGWSLMAGGTISRTVMGSPDEKIVSYSIGSSNPKIGIYFDENTSVNIYKNYFASYIENPNTATNTQKSIFEAHYKNRYDTQYDLYQYNFLHYTGRFIVKKTGTELQVHKLDKNNLKISVNAPVNFEPISFDIIDEFGNKFTFDILETSQTSSFTNTLGLEMYSSTSASVMNIPYNSAFHLSKIKNGSNELKVSILYTDPVTIQSSENTSNNNLIEYSSGQYSSNVINENKALLPKISETSSNTTVSQIRKVKEIDLYGKGKVLFEYENGREDSNYLGGSNAAMLSKLKSIVLLGSDKKFNEKYILNYDYKETGVYKRLFLNSVQKMKLNNSSYIQDYNYQLDYYIPQYSQQLVAGEDLFFKCYGENSHGCSDTELLKSVTYPTKGKSEFIYELGTFSYVPETTTGMSSGAFELLNYDENELNWDAVNALTTFTNFSSGEQFAFTLDENTDVKFVLNTSQIDQYPWHLIIKKKVGNSYSEVGGTGLAYSQNNIPPTEYNTSLQAGDYYLELLKATPGSNSPFNASFYAYYKKRNDNNYKFLHDYRANRVKSINYYSDQGSVPQRTLNFNYHNLSNPKKSTGALVWPRPVHSYSTSYSAGMEYTCNQIQTQSCVAVFITNIKYNSTRNFLPTQKTKGGDIGYQYVSVTETNRGKTVYQYTSPVDKPNLYTPATLPPFNTVADYDYTRGNLLNKKIFDNSNRLLTEDQYNYNYSSYDVTTGASVNPIILENIGYYLHGGRYTNYEDFVASTIGLKQFVGNDPFAFLGLGFQTEHIGTANLVQEKSISYYPDQRSATITTHNEYNTRDYLTKKTVTSTDGNITETVYKYAHEKGNTKLINANMIAIPLEVSVTEKESPSATEILISKSETKYDNPANLFPSSVLSFDFQNNPSTEVTYDQYDSKGNIQQYTTKDGIPTAIIWGYNSTQPIAKLTGAPYSVAIGFASDIISASDLDASQGTVASEQNLIDKLDIFRKASGLSEAQISTYSYDPLIGVRSITPPSGIREVYLYDSANRLENIKDIDGKVLKEFKYNYKH